MAAVQTLEKGLLLEMLRRMLRIRRFAEQVVRLVERGEIVGAAHPTSGRKPSPWGLSRLARGRLYDRQPPLARPSMLRGQVQKAMAELFGKRTGLCKGKGGSMHLADFSVGILGESGILGRPSLQRWAALGSKLQGNDRVAVAFFGDGASNEGAFHESINLAAVWKLRSSSCAKTTSTP